MTLILPWFPIVLAVGVAGRLLGRTGGLGVGFACALFWVALVQASVGVTVWHGGWTVMTMIAGSIAIVAMGGWAGQSPTPALANPTEAASPAPPIDAGTASVLGELASQVALFDDWLEEHRNDANPWPAFGEFIRNALLRMCEATHVQPYRLRGEGEELIALHAPNELGETEPISARQGVVGHVVTTGRSYLEGDATQGDLVQSLATDAKRKIAWCFPITQGTRRLGAVVVGQLPFAPRGHGEPIRAIERLIAQWWRMLREAEINRSQAQRDPVSGLYTRPAFLRAASQALTQSYQHGEPVTLVAVAVEGLRDLSDSARWERADELLADVAESLRRKIRTDDRLGRFDGSRFILLLRRVDSELASLIVEQLVSRLRAVCSDVARWGTTIQVRCGVVGSGTEHPELRTLVAQALVQCRRAREQGLSVAADLPTATRDRTLPLAAGASVGMEDHSTAPAAMVEDEKGQTATEREQRVDETSTGPVEAANTSNA